VTYESESTLESAGLTATVYRTTRTNSGAWVDETGFDSPGEKRIKCRICFVRLDHILGNDAVLVRKRRVDWFPTVRTTTTTSRKQVS
jgi:hypothetical protein